MRSRQIVLLARMQLIALLATIMLTFQTAMARESYQVIPAEVALHGNFERAQLLVQQVNKAGISDQNSNDLTHTATYTSSDPAIVTVDSRGRLLAVANGQAVIRVKSKRWKSDVTVIVDGVV